MFLGRSIVLNINRNFKRDNQTITLYGTLYGATRRNTALGKHFPPFPAVLTTVNQSNLAERLCYFPPIRRILIKLHRHSSTWNLATSALCSDVRRILHSVGVETNVILNFEARDITAEVVSTPADAQLIQLGLTMLRKRQLIRPSLQK